MAARGESGVKVPTRPDTLVVPGTGTPPVDTVKVDPAVSESPFTTSLNVASTVVFLSTPAAPLAGDSAVTVGNVNALLVKVQE